MKELIQDYISYIKNEKHYSDNTIINYQADLDLFYIFCNENSISNINDIDYQTIRLFLNYLVDNKYSNKAMARHISSLRSFYKYLKKNNIVKNNPMTLISNPKIEKKLPKVVYSKELEEIFNIPDRTTPLGVRNLLILELLY